MLVKEIIRKKRDGGELSEQEIKTLIEGLADQKVSREQIAAFTMAVYFKSMSIAEVSALTRAMVDSGHKLNWKQHNLGGPVVDKHSTGGVGDKVSLMLAPMIAACGGFVPMISGRGLGHSGGTLDKMESIPGYNTTPDLDKLAQVVKDVGCAIIGQTAELAPADRVIYSVRDVTATVESVALITASILSKKISAGLDALVMDIKVGNGAFMETEAEAEELATSIIRTAQENNVPTHAIITSMDEVLGHTAGNALEVRETLDYLSGQNRDPNLHEVVMALTSEMLVLTKLASDRTEAKQKLQTVLDNGKAMEIFAQMITALGGPADFVEKSENYLAKAPIIKPVFAPTDGYISTIDVRGIGNSIIRLGGGRSVPGQELDMAVGYTNIARIGDYADPEMPLAMVHARTEADADQAIADIQNYYKLSERKPQIPKVIRKLLT
ncbi:MAG: thymidine phosphorylase [Emcibacter sp.]|nr:thymidine phosphorylase [Emcibacter sp.]